MSRLAMVRHHGHDIADPPGIRAAEDASVQLIENAVGSFPVPIGIATNFLVNGEERIVTMATEERSVIAAASYAAKLCREDGGFRVTVGDNVAVGQIFYGPSTMRNALISARDAAAVINRRSHEFIEQIGIADDPMRKHGGGLRDVSTRDDVRHDGPLIISVIVDVADAMGANVVTRMGETLAAILEPMLGVKPTAVICTNEAQGPLVSVKAEWPTTLLDERIVTRILELQTWAETDKARAVTHNKGVMNGISAVCLATGQDVRAVEAAAHASAADKSPQYGPLTKWHWRPGDHTIRGELNLHIPLGTVGGATSHPTAVWCRELMGAKNVRDLAAIVGAVGLAQNFAALRSLADEGIPAAHVRLKRDR